MQAVVVDPNIAGRLALASVEAPRLALNETLVRVSAVSLNRGEVRNSGAAQAGFRPGWDLAGTVEQAAADGSGPKVGARVVGFVGNGAWAELVAVPTNRTAELPAEVTFAQAATLPVAGLTALYGLEKGGSLLQKRVLITGASGGVGHFGVQLARQMGAIVVGHTRSAEREAFIREAGAHHVATGENAGNAADFGPYGLVLDGVAGQTLTEAIKLLAPGGIYVLYGGTPATESTFNLGAFFRTGGLTMYGFILFYEVLQTPASDGLKRLAAMIAAGTLRAPIEVEAPWTEVGKIAQQLMDRGYAGKAVLHLS
ncbi:MAG: zinc-binding dehydrogenase [Aggregatilineales bacterium]